MTDYLKYINALRKCAKEHENDRTSTGHIIVSDLCRDTANLLEELEQEPITKNDSGVDYIDRQATLDAIIKRLGINNESYLLPAERTIYQQIKDMSPVTPIRPKGHWIPRNSFLLQYKCSECGFESEKYNYCPNCGSRNEVEE